MDDGGYCVTSDREAFVEVKTSLPFQELAIGIDIGTSQCSVAFWNGTEVELVRNAQNQKLIRSFVTYKDEVPEAGVTNQLSHEYEMLSGDAIFNVKRLIGRIDTDPVVVQASKTQPFLVQTLDIGARPFIAALVNNVWRSTTLEEVLTIFLMELRAMAETRLKKSIRNVVLTVPVSFSRFQVARMERVCAAAGLKVLKLMHEPTAVALLYAQQQLAGQDNMGLCDYEKIALIFNMGAGYCDVAVTTTGGGISEIKALTGSTIGGEDILQNMMHYLLPITENLISGRIRSMGLLRVATQDAIHQLSSQTSVKVEVDLGNGVQISKVITRHEFEKVNCKVFEKCDNLVRQCLHDARVDVDNVEDVILVGGCSSIPKIRNLVTDICKKKEVYQGMNPLEAAVRGAALQGAVASGISGPSGILDLLTIQVTPLGIGIQANGDSFIPVIPKNTTIPTTKELAFTTVADNQTEALILVYEGEEDKAVENHLLGYFKVVGIPASPKGVAEINVCMDINSLNVLRVLVDVVMPGSPRVAAPLMEVRMPTVDDGHGWCAEALNKTYGSTLGLVTLPKKPLIETPI